MLITKKDSEKVHLSRDGFKSPEAARQYAITNFCSDCKAAYLKGNAFDDIPCSEKWVIEKDEVEEEFRLPALANSDPAPGDH